MKVLKVESVLHLHRLLNAVDALDEFGTMKNLKKTLAKMDEQKLRKLQFHCREVVAAFDALKDAPIKVEIDAQEPEPAPPEPAPTPEAAHA